MEGMSTQIKGETYCSTKTYVDTFVSAMKKLNCSFRCFVKTSDQTVMYGTASLPVFNQVLVQAILPEQKDGYFETINLVYSLDNLNPAYKFYKGWSNQQGLLVIPNRDFVIGGKLLPGDEIPSDFNKMINMKFDMKDWEDGMNIPIKDRHLFLGEILDKTLSTELCWEWGDKSKLGTGDIIKAYYSLFCSTNCDSIITPIAPKEVTFYDFFTTVESCMNIEKDFYCLPEKALIVNSVISDYLTSLKKEVADD